VLLRGELREHGPRLSVQIYFAVAVLVRPQRRAVGVVVAHVPVAVPRTLVEVLLHHRVVGLVNLDLVLVPEESL